jgi:hypothetical protein
MRAGQFLVGILTLVVAINLAILIYARTMTRLGEIAVRSALGASRARILAQLFIEALALSLAGAGVGLTISRYALGVIQALAHTNGGLPYWVTFELSMASVLYAVGLAFVAAFIMGVLPGLKATGARINANLHELHGRGGTRLGRTWTTLIVAQVAVAVAVLPVAVFVAARVIRMEMAGAGFAADSIVVARAEVDLPAGKLDGDLLRAREADLIARLRREPGVVGVAFASSIPGFAGSEQIRFEDGVRRRTGAEHVPDVGITDALFPSVVRGSADLFDTYGVQVLAGRNFTAADAATPEAVIVNTASRRCICRMGTPWACASSTYGMGKARLLEEARRLNAGWRSSAWSATSLRFRRTSSEPVNPRFTTRRTSATCIRSRYPCDSQALCLRISSDGSGRSAPRSIQRCNCTTSACLPIATRKGARHCDRSRGRWDWSH